MKLSTQHRASGLGEEEFAKDTAVKLQNLLPGYIVTSAESILYKLSIDPDGKLIPSDYAKPTRGQLAFQTDILVKNQKVPLVVIETKIHNPTTHDVLTYSAKAIKHKEVYPYLRYGLLIGSYNRIDNRFFVHNVGFDFALAIHDPNDDMKELASLVDLQIKASEQLQSVLGKRSVRKYLSSIELS